MKYIMFVGFVALLTLLYFLIWRQCVRWKNVEDVDFTGYNLRALNRRDKID